jgi:hypothetical protein
MHNAIITMLIGDALLLFLYDRLVVSREDRKGSGIMRYESHGHIAAQPHGITNAIWPDLEKVALPLDIASSLAYYRYSNFAHMMS